MGSLSLILIKHRVDFSRTAFPRLGIKHRALQIGVPHPHLHCPEVDARA